MIKILNKRWLKAWNTQPVHTSRVKNKPVFTGNSLSKRPRKNTSGDDEKNGCIAAELKYASSR